MSSCKSDAKRSGRAKFHVGQSVWFWSGEGVWKPGVVAEVSAYFNRRKKCWICSVRLRVGDGVYIIRPIAKCKKRRVNGRMSFMSRNTESERGRKLPCSSS
jgi:hypothetical protein